MVRGSPRRFLTRLDVSSSKVYISFVVSNNLLRYLSHVTQIAQQVIPSNEHLFCFFCLCWLVPEEVSCCKEARWSELVCVGSKLIFRSIL